MIKGQLKELPSVSQVLHEIKSDISLHNRYIKEIINCQVFIRVYKNYQKQCSEAPTLSQYRMDFGETKTNRKAPVGAP